MAFEFDNLIIDRVINGFFEDSQNNILGMINQVQNFSLNTTGETKDKTDAKGVLIKRFFTAKTVEVSAESALFSLSLMGLQTGSGKTVASSENKIVLPRVMTVSKTDSPITLPDTPIEGTLIVAGTTGSNVATSELQYTQNTEAGENEYSITGTSLSLPTNATDKVIVKYEYEAETGVKVIQKSDKFPKECKFTVSVLVCDACDKETLRHAYIVFPAYQMSPDFDLTLDTESAHGFSGTATVDYCSPDQLLFYVAMSDNDVEDAE